MTGEVQPRVADAPTIVVNTSTAQMSAALPADDGIPQLALEGPEVVDTAHQFERAAAYVVEWDEDVFNLHISATPEALRASLRSALSLGQQRLVVIHGLPAKYVEVLRDELDIDAELIEAQAARRSHRSSRHGTMTQCLSLEYPELVQKEDSESGLLNPGPPEMDFLESPPIYKLSNSDNMALMCHASLLVGDNVDVLFLDRSSWRDPTTCLVRAQRRHLVTRPCECEDGKQHAWEMGYSINLKEVESLEERLSGELSHRTVLRRDLPRVISSFVLDQWTELLEITASGIPFGPTNLSALIWQMQTSLEKNLHASSTLGTQESLQKSTAPEWEALLNRFKRQIKLASRSSSQEIRIEVPKRDAKSSKDNPDSDVEQRKPPESSDSQENQRSLDRVAYLGGILLPLTTVSGVLSMSDDFAPTGSMFYVFWAAAVPLTLFTLLVIYADSIRKLEVWVEVASEHGDDSDTNGQKPERVSTPQLEGVIPISYSEPISLSEPIPVSNRMGEVQTVERFAEVQSAPVTIVQERFRNKKHRAWKKEELGWMGACKTIFQLNKLKKSQIPPSGARIRGRNRTY